MKGNPIKIVVGVFRSLNAAVKMVRAILKYARYFDFVVDVFDYAKSKWVAIHPEHAKDFEEAEKEKL